MGEEAKLFIGQGVKIMVGDKPVGFAKGGTLTIKADNDGATKDSGAWENPMHHSFEITGKAVVTNVGDPIRELLNDMPGKVDVEIRRELGKMPRKMKKAYRTGSRYRRDTKWKRKAKAYERRFIYRLPNAEMVVIGGGVIFSDRIVEEMQRYKASFERDVELSARERRIVEQLNKKEL